MFISYDKNNMKELEEKGIFFIPAGNEFGQADNETVYIVYAPLPGRTFLISGREKDNIEQKLLLLSKQKQALNLISYSAVKKQQISHQARLVLCLLKLWVFHRLQIS